MPSGTSIRVSVTSVDDYHYYRDSLDDDGRPRMTLEDHLRRLKRVDPPTDAMRRGSAFHEHIETGGRAHRDDFGWEIDVSLPKPSVREMPCARSFRVRGLDVELRGRVDAVVGRTVVDYKLSSWNGNYERYQDAFQWRAYLSMLPHCVDFSYEHFTMRARRHSTAVDITHHAAYRLNRYAGLPDDVEEALDEYVGHLLELEERGLVNIDGFGVMPLKVEIARGLPGWRP